jgi:hypothetical protein
MYIALATSPDIAYAVTTLSRYNTSPFQMHLTAAKIVLRYPKTIIKCELHRGDKPQSTLEGFTDSYWAGSKDNRKSMGRYIFFHGGPIFWQAKGQSVVAH